MKSSRSSLGILFFTVFLDLVGFGIILPVLPIYAKALGASGLMIGLVASIFSVMTFIFSPLIGRMSDRIGRRPALLGGITLSMVSYVIFGYSGTLFLLLLSRMLSGIGASNISVAQAYITDVADPAKRAKSLGLIGAAFGLGFIFGPAIGGWMKTAYGIEGVGLTAAGLSALNLVLAFSFLPESLKERKTASERVSLPTAIRKAFHHPGKSRLLTLVFVFTFAWVMMQISFALFANERLGMTERGIGTAFAAMGVVSAILQGTLIGRLTARFGERKLLIAGTLFMAAGLTLVPVVPSWEVTFVVLPLTAIGSGLMNPSIASLLSSFSSPVEQGETLGLSQSASSLARILGPIAGSLLYEQEFHSPYFAGGLLMLVCTIMVVPLLRTPSTGTPAAR
jgi:MFS family permease